MCRSELFASVRTTSISLRLEIAVVLPAPMGPVKRMTCSAISAPESLAKAAEEALALDRSGLRNDLDRGSLRRAGQDAHEAERVDESLSLPDVHAGVSRELCRAHIGVAEHGNHLHLAHVVRVLCQVR